MDIKSLSSWGLSKAIYDVIENGFAFDEETGEVYFTSEDLDALQETLDNKLNGIVGFIKVTENQVEMQKARKKEIEDNIKFYERRAEKLKDYLKVLMEANNIEKKELPDYRLGFRKSNSVNIFDEESLMNYLKEHPEYNDTCVKTEVKTSIIKTGIKEVINNGVVVPGANIVENKNITIK